jgi:hypothetical protein
VPAFDRGGAGMRRRLNGSHASPPCSGAAVTFVSFIPLFDGNPSLPTGLQLSVQISEPGIQLIVPTCFQIESLLGLRKAELCVTHVCPHERHLRLYQPRLLF